jgi:hypothetical protein
MNEPPRSCRSVRIPASLLGLRALCLDAWARTMTMVRIIRSRSFSTASRGRDNSMIITTQPISSRRVIDPPRDVERSVSESSVPYRPVAGYHFSFPGVWHVGPKVHRRAACIPSSSFAVAVAVTVGGRRSGNPFSQPSSAARRRWITCSAGRGHLSLLPQRSSSGPGPGTERNGHAPRSLRRVERPQQVRLKTRGRTPGFSAEEDLHLPGPGRASRRTGELDQRARPERPVEAPPGGRPTAEAARISGRWLSRLHS